MTRPKKQTPPPGDPVDVRVYTQGTVRAVVRVDGAVSSSTGTGYTADSYRARCNILTQKPDGSWV